MQLAYKYIAEMLKTQYIKNFQKMYLPRPIDSPSSEHRRIDINWSPASNPGQCRIFDVLEEYKKEGYRAYTVGPGIRLAKGDLTALSFYNLMLESRSLTSFYHQGDSIRMKFIPKDGEINSYERSKYPILAKIKDYTFKSDGFDITIMNKIDTSMIGSGKVSYEETKKLATFMIKDKPVDPGLQDLLNRAKPDIQSKVISPSEMTAEDYVKGFSSKHNDVVNTIKDVEKKLCKDCKDGFYYPFAGPREVCQTCFKKPNDINFAERVAAIFSELLFLDLGATKIKMVKTFNYHWQTFSVDLGCSKDHSCEVSLAQKAVDMMVHKLTHQYKQAIAFEDVSLPPPTKKDMIHLISNFSSVSALISMHETSIGPQFQFQVRVSL